MLSIVRARGVGSMRNIGIVFAIMVLGGCWGQSGGGASGAEQALAKCKISASTGEGIEFRRNYFKGAVIGTELDQAMWNPVPYRQYMSLCMQSQGFNFKDLSLKAADEGDECWQKIDGTTIPIMSVDDHRCYRR
jgi:hypothetical protein